MNRNRRGFIRALSASALLTAATGCASVGRSPETVGRVVVIGGGFGGATAARYIRMWSPDIAVTLVEPNRQFVSCPLSNRVLAGTWQLSDLTSNYDGLERRGVRLVHQSAVDIDPVRQVVTLGDGQELDYDRLIVAPGIELDYEGIPGLRDPASRESIPHAWKAGPQTALLRKQLEDMSDGGVCAITVPRSPYRCPPGPYERACQIAHYFRTHKPRSKVLVLDANEDIQSKKALFRAAWEERYPGIIEYRANNALVDVDVSTRTAILDFDDVQADVLNVVPPQRAGRIARDAGLITANGKWCEVDFLSYESVAVPNVHVLGDSVMAAPRMPKSGHMANQHGKVCAAAIIELLHGNQPDASPLISNTCYSFVSDRDVIHVASVHEYDSQQRTMVPIKGAGGLSNAANEAEGLFAESWGTNIWHDVLG
ncbi:MAG TPA: NAD(P)/FAD-dependent oxidoreductase [Burkholderiales bacterium]|nr:NAD(P)/FAD-dependent oxidoreductase [Burkholderiales bacterium]